MIDVQRPRVIEELNKQDNIRPTAMGAVKASVDSGSASAELAMENEQLAQRLADVSTEKEKLLHEKYELEEMVEALDAKLRKSAEDDEALRRRLLQRDETALQKEMAKLTREMKEHESTVDKLTQEKNYFQSQWQETREQLHARAQEAVRLEAIIEQLRENDDTAADLAMMKEIDASQKKKIRELQAAAKAAEEDLKTAEEQTESLRAQLEQLNRELAASKRGTARRGSMLTDLDEELLRRTSGGASFADELAGLGAFVPPPAAETSSVSKADVERLVRALDSGDVLALCDVAEQICSSSNSKARAACIASKGVSEELKQAAAKLKAFEEQMVELRMALEEGEPGEVITIAEGLAGLSDSRVAIEMAHMTKQLADLQVRMLRISSIGAGRSPTILPARIQLEERLMCSVYDLYGLMGHSAEC